MVDRSSSAGHVSTSSPSSGGRQATSAAGQVTRGNVRVRFKLEFMLPAGSETPHGQAMTSANPVDAVPQGLLQQKAESTESKGEAGLQQ